MPTLAPGTPTKTRTLTVRVTATQRQLIDATAQQSGVTTSDLVRAAVLRLCTSLAPGARPGANKT